MSANINSITFYISKQLHTVRTDLLTETQESIGLSTSKPFSGG